MLHVPRVENRNAIDQRRRRSIIPVNLDACGADLQFCRRANFLEISAADSLPVQLPSKAADSHGVFAEVRRAVQKSRAEAFGAAEAHAHVPRIIHLLGAEAFPRFPMADGQRPKLSCFGVAGLWCSRGACESNARPGNGRHPAAAFVPARL